jgi:hypothetical protein
VASIGQGPNRLSSRKIRYLSANRVQEVNHHVRNMVILGLALEIAFLTILAAYELSSIFRFQN